MQKNWIFMILPSQHKYHCIDILITFSITEVC